MFERFTDRARRVVVLAQEEARLLYHSHIGTEHLLLGLIHEGEGVAAKVLSGLDVDEPQVRALVEEMVGKGETGVVEGHIPFTPRAKTALEMSLREALQLGHNYIGTEHMLLGLIREGDGVGAEILFKKLGLDPREIRERVISVLSGYQPGAGGEKRPIPVPSCPTCRSPLQGRLGSQILTATDEEGAVDSVTAIYCRNCGGLLAVLPAPGPADA